MHACLCFILILHPMQFRSPCLGKGATHSMQVFLPWLMESWWSSIISFYLMYLVLLMYFYFNFIWHELWIQLISLLIFIILLNVRGELMFLSYGGVMYVATIQTHAQADLHTLMKPPEMILLPVCFEQHDLVAVSWGALPHLSIPWWSHSLLLLEKNFDCSSVNLVLLFFMNHGECCSSLGSSNSSHLTYSSLWHGICVKMRRQYLINYHAEWRSITALEPRGKEIHMPVSERHESMYSLVYIP